MCHSNSYFLTLEFFCSCFTIPALIKNCKAVSLDFKDFFVASSIILIYFCSTICAVVIKTIFSNLVVKYIAKIKSFGNLYLKMISIGMIQNIFSIYI